MWHPVQVVSRVTITGGHMRKPCSLDCETVEVTGQSLRMFPIGKQEGWLIGMVTGHQQHKRALKRCGIFISLKDRLHSIVEGASGNSDDKMSTMRFDDEEEVSPVKKNTKRSREVDEKDSPRQPESQILCVDTTHASESAGRGILERGERHLAHVAQGPVVDRRG